MERVCGRARHLLPQEQPLTFSGPVDAEYLTAWARHAHRSPLYAHLIDLTIHRPELMRIIERIHNRPPPNVYLAAIHFLLMEDRS